MSELSELFDRDPLSLTDQDIAKIVARMRESQAQYELGVKTKPEPKPKSTKAAALLQDLFGPGAGASADPLKDLGLK